MKRQQQWVGTTTLRDAKAPGEERRCEITAKPATAQADSGKELGRIYSRYKGDLTAFARRWGFQPEDAEDLTQEFFLRVAARNWFNTYDPRKGAFRSFVLTLFQRFLANERRSRNAFKRGGGVLTQSLDWSGSSEGELSDWKSPDAVVELHWARLVLSDVMESLRRDLRRRGKLRVFNALLPHMLHEAHKPTRGQSAGNVGLSAAAARMKVSRYRERLRNLICSELHCYDFGDGLPQERVRQFIQLFSR